MSSKNIFAEFVRDKRKYGNDDDLFGTLITTNKLSKYALIRSMYEDCGNFYLDRKYEIAQKYIEDIDKSELIRDKQIQIYYKYAVRGRELTTAPNYHWAKSVKPSIYMR